MTPNTTYIESDGLQRPGDIVVHMQLTAAENAYVHMDQKRLHISGLSTVVGRQSARRKKTASVRALAPPIPVMKEAAEKNGSTSVGGQERRRVGA